MATVLVTGGAGFIGSHLVDALLNAGDRVRVLDNFSTGRRENLQHVLSDIELVEGDIQSYERVHTAVRGCDVVLHQAALPSVPRSVQDPLTSTAVNVTGTLNLLLAARDEGVRRVVAASSSSVYGKAPQLPKDEGIRPEPISPYAVAKLAGEGFSRSFGEVYGLETVALRYFNVFGPRQDPASQYAAVIPNFIVAALEGRRPTIHGDGEQSRDFTYVDNVVDGNLLAMNAPAAAGEVMNLACGDAITLNELVDHLRDILGVSIDPEHVDPRPGDVRHSRADNARAREVLEWQPRVGFVEGLQRTADSLIESRSMAGTA
jgi:UDP-glucose 4-epimerase